LLRETFLPDTDDAGPRIDRAEAAVLISGWAQDRPSPLHFRTGDITVCTLLPMRSVPYRVVCLVGMDDERFPRIGSSDGDDLLAEHEIIGDPYRSAEDRQLLLDAVMAAGDHLLITYSGRDELTSAKYPPAVPIAELSDVLRAMVGTDAVRALTTKHPLQGFGRDNFIAGRLGADGPWSFDPMQLDGARAIQRGPVSRPAPTVDVAAALEVDDPISLTNVISFLQHPARWHLRNHLQVTIPSAAEAVDDTLAVDVNALEAWALKERILAGLGAGGDLDTVAAHLRASDALPPGDLGIDDLDDAVAQASGLWELAVEHDFAPRRHRRFGGQVNVAGVTVEGKVEADPEADHLATLTASRLGARQRIAAACELAFLSALVPETAWRAVLIGKAERGNGRTVVTLGPIARSPECRLAGAIDLLAGLLAIYVEAHSRSVPLPPKTAYGWQRGLSKGRGEAFKRARDEWVRDRFSPESKDPANVMVFPDLLTIEALLDSDFTEYAQKLWLPILALSGEKTK
jgi:exodeoxyribonuclease V gamma subunit